MRILQVVPALNTGGVEQGCIDIAKALIMRGHPALIVSSGGRLTGSLNEMGATHFQLPVHSKNPLRILMNAFTLAKLCRQFEVDLIHVRSRAPAWTCWLLQKCWGIPYLSTFHGQYGHHSRLKRLYNSAMLRGRACITVSDFIAHHINLTYASLLNQGANSSEQLAHKPAIIKILRGINLDYFAIEKVDNLVKESLIKRWQLDVNEPLLILPGRLTRLKGHQLVIDALAGLPRTTKYLCLFIGPTKTNDHYLKELKKSIQQKGLSDKIKFVGDCDHMREAYALSDLVISASTKPESFGRIAVEAQAMGCTVLASKHGGSEETIAPNNAWGLFEPNSSQALTQTLSLALQLPPTCNKNPKDAALQTRDFIQKSFDTKRMEKETLALYAKLIKQSK